MVDLCEKNGHVILLVFGHPWVLDFIKERECNANVIWTPFGVFWYFLDLYETLEDVIQMVLGRF